MRFASCGLVQHWTDGAGGSEARLGGMGRKHWARVGIKLSSQHETRICGVSYCSW